MKILLIIQMVIGFMLVAREARSATIECSVPSYEKHYICYSENHDFGFSRVHSPDLAEKAFELIDEGLTFPVGGIILDFDAFLKSKAVRNARPLMRHWDLPAYTLLSLGNKGIQKIQGRTIPQLIDEAKKVQWDNFIYFDLLNRRQPQRNTGFYNSVTDRVVYDRDDLMRNDLSDVQHWALHEVFGTASINDKNYELSTMAMLVNDGHMTAKEFHDNQYNHTNLILPLMLGSTIIPILFEKEDDSKYFEKNTTSRSDTGGITGVEGGGDVISASIKRYMLLALKNRQGGTPLTREQIKTILNHDIHYAGFEAYFRVHQVNAEDKTKPLYLSKDNGTPVIVLSNTIRSAWPDLDEAKKLELGKQYNDFIKIGDK